jgi:Na+-transporting NADH:ubiquinone oxidoreductase subunit A
MTHIKITKGLDIPIKGRPSGNIEPLIAAGGASVDFPIQVALNLKPFDQIKFKLLVRPGDVVKIGQPIAEDKFCSGRMFCSPGSGVIKEVRRGLKRSLTDIVIELSKQEEYQQLAPLNVAASSRDLLVDRLNHGGLFAHIRSRPFNELADPAKMPRNIFVKAVESAPLVPPAELQVIGHEKEFQAGLDVLAKLTEGSVHLVYHKDSTLKAFTEAQNVQKHTAEGPHPIGTHSLHIQWIDPVKSADDNIWTLDAHDVVSVGHLVLNGKYFIERVISIAGPGVLPERTGYFRVREGYPISHLASGRVQKGLMRLVSGDPLMGKKVDSEDFLGFHDFCFCIIPEGTEREFLHFFRLGSRKYSFSRAYASGHFDNKNREYDFTTSRHGEHRAFIDSTLYDEVMPLPISTMTLVKAVMAEDYDLAAELGLLGVDEEDFALPTFVDPSKNEMIEIMKNGLRLYAQDMKG